MTIKPLYVDKPTLSKITSLSESSLEKLMRESKFPRPRQLSAGRAGWLMREVEAWAEACPPSEMLPPANTGARKSAQ